MVQLLVVADDAAWEQLRQRDLMTVVDPMVLRTAELFFSGAPSDGRARSAIWAAIDANLAALMTFVDVVVTQVALPVFSYGAAFPDNNLFGLDQLAELLWPVAVSGDAYLSMVRSASAEVDRRMATAAAEGSLLDGILSELAAFEYEWRPLSLPDALSERDQRLHAFLLGLLVFDGFAQQLSVEGGRPAEQARRVVQPRRSRLFAEIALGNAPRDRKPTRTSRSLPRSPRS